MLFNSIEFLIFFPVVSIGYFLLSMRWRWAWLLAASCYFYMAFRPVYILILGFTILVDYYAGIWIEESEGPKRKAFLVLSLIANIGVLCVFKYYNFFVSNFNLYSGSALPMLDILLPIGLSFHTFQAMSYTIEVYRGHQKAERHFGIYSLYVMFYPQLVAGPIERPQNILPQLHTEHRFNYENVRAGLLLAAWGMFKKVVIADRLAAFADQVYNNPTAYEGPSIAVASVFFAFQIYCDFSGYSDIAIGTAQVMGIRLMQNFDQPYSSRSIGEFWRRWHISLSTWFRDYVYIPLGGNRKGRARTICNTLIIFGISGLWHGANWNYILWGGLHGLYLTAGMLTLRIRKKLFAGLQDKAFIRIPEMILTFILVTFAWIFFRADYSDSSMLGNLLGNLGKGWDGLLSKLTDLDYFMKYICLGQKRREFALAILLILFLEAGQRFFGDFRDKLFSLPGFARWACYLSLVLATLYLGVFDNKAQFIYFQF